VKFPANLFAQRMLLAAFFSRKSLKSVIIHERASHLTNDNDPCALR